MPHKRDPRPDCPNCRKHSMVTRTNEPQTWRCFCGEKFVAADGARVTDAEPPHRKRTAGSGVVAGKPYYRGLIWASGYRGAHADA